MSHIPHDVQVGSMMLWGPSTPPPNWLIVNGSSFSGTDYPALAEHLGGTTLPTKASVVSVLYVLSNIIIKAK